MFFKMMMMVVVVKTMITIVWLYTVSVQFRIKLDSKIYVRVSVICAKRFGKYRMGGLFWRKQQKQEETVLKI